MNIIYLNSKSRAIFSFNISISEDDTLGTKVEVKNVNSFSGVYNTLLYEIKRQSELKDADRYDEVNQETRRWDEESGTTIRMRSKVDAEDYKYFVEPNIPKYKITKEWLEEIRAGIPELPYERKKKYKENYGLSEKEAHTLVKEIGIATYFEKCIALDIESKIAANWITGNILGYLNKYELEIKEFYLTPERLQTILNHMKKGDISSKQAKELFFLVLERKEEPDTIMKEEGMEQISDDSALRSVITEVLDENASQIEAYKNGKTNMFDYFVGQVMKKTRGQANPVKGKEILTEELRKR